MTIITGIRRCVLYTGILVFFFSFSSYAAQAGDQLKSLSDLNVEGQIVQLMSVPDPDLSRVEQEVRERLEKVRQELNVLLNSSTVNRSKLARAFGELASLYHVHHVYIPAEPAYLNAQLLAPDRFKWLYYQGVLAQQTSQLEKAGEVFEKAWQLRQDYSPLILRLAEIATELGQYDKALAYLQKIKDDKTLATAVWAAEGRLALAGRDYSTAAKFFRQALTKQPQASSIHYPLAMAYRGLNKVSKAKQHLALHGSGQIAFDDPLMRQLNQLQGGARTNLYKAMVAVKTREWAIAAKAFSGALLAEPENHNIRISLARSLLLSGDREQATQQLDTVLVSEPENSMANFFRGLIWHEDSDTTQAEKHYRQVLKSDAQHAGAMYYLAQILYQKGRYRQSKALFYHAHKLTPGNYNAKYYGVVSDILSGVRYDDIVEKLQKANTEFPEKPHFRFLLARIISVQPKQSEEAIQLALDYAKALVKAMDIPENNATMAMAHAASGDYSAAIIHQQIALMQAIDTGRYDLLPWLKSQLLRYQQEHICDAPFAAEDPALKLFPVNIIGPFLDYPVISPY